MKTLAKVSSCSFLCFLISAVCAPTNVMGESVRVFYEDFGDIVVGNSSNTTNGSNSAWSSNNITTNFIAAGCERLYQAGGAVRLGTASANGILTTRTMDVSGGEGSDVLVVMNVKGWTTGTDVISVALGNQTAQTITPKSVAVDDFEEAQFVFNTGTAEDSLVITTTYRAFIDDIAVYVRDGVLSVLPAPEALAATEIYNPSFVAEWTAVQEARAYDVNVFAVSRDLLTTNAVAGSPFSVSGSATRLKVTGLSRNTKHLYNVVARGYNNVSEDSEPSNTIEVWTANNLLESPSAINVTDATYCSFDVEWEADSDAVGYEYDLWYGSVNPASVDVDEENFFDWRLGVLPSGWSLDNRIDFYENTTYDEDTMVRIQFFDEKGISFYTRMYPAALTEFTFSVRLTGSNNEEGRLIVDASANGENWTTVKTYSSTAEGDDLISGQNTHRNKTLTFDAQSNYRRLRFTFYKGSRNLGIGSFAAKYAGAGTKTVYSSLTNTTTANSISATKLKPNTEYYLRLRAVDDGGTPSLDSRIFRIMTADAPKESVVIVR